jgi:hypothetical protein
MFRIHSQAGHFSLYEGGVVELRIDSCFVVSVGRLPPHLNGRSLRHLHAQPAQDGSPYRLQQPRPRMIVEYLGIADRHSQRPPGSYAERPWDELPECSGSIHHLRD